MELRRNVLVPARRRSPACSTIAGIAIATGITTAVATILVSGLVLAPDAPPRDAPTTREVRPLVVQVPVPLSLPLPAPMLPVCPAPHSDAPIVDPPALGATVEHVRPSPSDARWIAAWSHDRVYISRDAGATFRAVLDGDGVVRDVSFDCFGHALVVRGERLGVRDERGEHWSVVPGFVADDNDEIGSGLVIAGGGPDAVVIGRTTDGARVAISPDLGATWRFREVAQTLEQALTAAQSADGTIRAWATLADCMNDDLVRVTVRGDKVATRMDAIPESPFVLWGGVAITADFGTPAWWTAESKQEPITGLPSGVGEVALVPGALPTIVVGDAAYRVEHGHARKLPVVVDGAPAAVDLAGRIWSIDCGVLRLARKTSHAVGCVGD